MRINVIAFGAVMAALMLWVAPVNALSAGLGASAALPAASGISSKDCVSRRQMRVGASSIDIVFDASDFSASETDICEWIGRGARAVQGYFGRFPVAAVRLELKPTGGSGVSGGSTYGDINGGALIVIRLGSHADNDALIADWVMTHEMVHLAVPSVPDRSHWLEEGIATYVEPIARVQQGELSARKIWADMRDGMPKGLPRTGDAGLDHTPTWGRTYWGGALFCLMADVEIRRRTGNRLGLQDALRGVLAAGGNIQHEGTAAQVFAIGDAATGVPVLTELYQQLGDAPGPQDIDPLWQRLGVIADDDVGVRFDATAPLASIRASITAPDSVGASAPKKSRS